MVDWYMMVARNNGTRFHAATVFASSGVEAHKAFKPDYGFGTLAIRYIPPAYINPRAQYIEAD